ncbi:MAG: Pre-mRNA-splicing factor cwc26 [Phylliscum demangeonii]|nr:MAG: Pre-mRNA-splicing factor cwc26 [Phylliscum demangeonii]
MTLADYLARNYLTADAPATTTIKRKRKRTAAAAASGLVIADDDDALDWSAPTTGKDDENGPTITTGGPSAEFRRAKTSTWRTVGVPAAAGSASDQAAADAIIASAAAEHAAAREADDNDGDDDDATDTRRPQVMESGARAGLQTAAQVTAAAEAQRARERARFEADAAARAGQHQATIYRDASGRVVNIAMQRAEARRAAEAEAAAAQAAHAAAQKGAVQVAGDEARQAELRAARYLPVARRADDDDLNADLKRRARWNDPAAAFLTANVDADRDRDRGTPAEGGGPGVRTGTGRPRYRGAFPPNRYGLAPGHRWDGVDRGNGFEGEYFAALNRRRNHRALDYAWQMDE